MTRLRPFVQKTRTGMWRIWVGPHVATDYYTSQARAMEAARRYVAKRSAWQ